MNACDHVCHEITETRRGLNPWVEECPTCRCANPKYDPKIPPPETWDELINWDHPDPALRPEKYKGLRP